MSKEYESADLLLKIYDLRREEKMREARNWWWQFNPKSMSDINALWTSKDGAKFSMVPAYWELVAALVNHNAIDMKMFLDANGEFYGIYIKLQPFLAEMRKENPEYLLQLETMIKKIPHIDKILETMKIHMQEWAKEKKK